MIPAARAIIAVAFFLLSTTVHRAKCFMYVVSDPPDNPHGMYFFPPFAVWPWLLFLPHTI